MSENRDRRTDRFSKYDSMPTEALEEILRLDAEAPEEQESDTELLLYVMGVLANRRRNTDITGNTAQQAWESFQKNYLDEECLEDMQEPKKHRTAASWLRRLTAAAAVIVLVVCLPLSANAFGWEDIWNIFARWAKETFSFVSEESAEMSEPAPTHKEEFGSLQELLADCKRDASIVPTWIPEGFVLDKIERDMTPVQEIYRALYLNGDKELRVRVQNYISTEFQKIETEDDFSEIYPVDGTDYYIFENDEQIQVVWIKDSYECNISGDISVEEAVQMIDSIGKG